MRCAWLAALLALAGGAAVWAGGEPAHPERLRGAAPADVTYTYAIGSFRPDYRPPPAGSYALPPIDTITDHPLLRSDGRPTSLFALKRDRLAVVAFVYTTCIDVTGCPLSMALLQRLDQEVAAHRDLARRVTLITVSFDPGRDTPARMAALREVHRPRSDWRFVTARGEAELAPLLADFDQPVSKLRFADGEWSGLFRHVLKVFLLDRGNRVRNVYSTGFLNPELVLNDLRTLLLEHAGPGEPPRGADPTPTRASAARSR